MLLVPISPSNVFHCSWWVVGFYSDENRDEPMEVTIIDFVIWRGTYPLRIYKVYWMYAQSRPILFDLMDCVACQAPLSVEFSRQEYWVSCHFLLQGIFPTQGLNPGPRIEPISPVSPALAGRFFTLSHLGSPRGIDRCVNKKVKWNLIINRYSL